MQKKKYVDPERLSVWGWVSCDRTKANIYSRVSSSKTYSLRGSTVLTPSPPPLTYPIDLTPL